MEVRQLTYLSPEIHDLLLEFYDEHRFGGLRFPLNETRARQYVDAYLQNGIVFGAFQDGDLVGSLALHEGPFWWSDERALWDGWFFVAGDRRASRAAQKLLDEAKRCADEKGLPLVVTVSHTADLDRKAKFFERRGFLTTGATFMYGGK